MAATGFKDLLKVSVLRSNHKLDLFMVDLKLYDPQPYSSSAESSSGSAELAGGTLKYVTESYLQSDEARKL
jgi:hypothetical protein